MANKPLTFGSLFAGIGGFDLGLERAGMVCKWQVEIDEYANRVLAKHWPNVPRHGDVRTFPTAEGDWHVDVICGGFPCQDISVAGKGAGLAGQRSGLWYEFARIIRQIQPRYVIVENVRAFTSRGIDTVLGQMASLGYDAEWHCIPACAVGAPHRRERIWIVAVWNANCQRKDCDRISDAKHGRAVSQAARRQPARVGGSPYVADAVGKPNAVRGNCASVQESVVGRQCDSGGGQCDCGKGCAEASRQGACHAADTNRAGCEQQRWPEPVPEEQSAAECGGWWSVEPDVGRVAHGVPRRVDRLRGLGNAVVPQVVEVIGRAIIESEAEVTL